MRLQVQSLALLSVLRIWRSCELWCRLQRQAQNLRCCGCDTAWQLQLQLEPQTGNFQMPQVRAERKKKKKVPLAYKILHDLTPALPAKTCTTSKFQIKCHMKFLPLQEGLP